jgi:hypothetical protein
MVSSLYPFSHGADTGNLGLVPNTVLLVCAKPVPASIAVPELCASSIKYPQQFPVARHRWPGCLVCGDGGLSQCPVVVVLGISEGIGVRHAALVQVVCPDRPRHRLDLVWGWHYSTFFPQRRQYGVKFE